MSVGKAGAPIQPARVVAHAGPVARLQRGPLTETGPLAAVAVAAPHNASIPLREFHKHLLQKLPPGVALFVLGSTSHLDPVLPPEQLEKRVASLPFCQGVSWACDYFPEFVRGADGKLRMVQFRYVREDFGGSVFNGVTAGRKIAEAFGLPLVESSINVQGGNLMVDDRRRLFTTERVLQDNPTLSRDAIEAELKRVLCVDSVEWLPELPCERTGHVDIYARYLGNNRMVVADSRNPARRDVLTRVADRLRQLGFEVIRVTNAEAATDNAFTQTYTNVRLVGQTVFVPTYADPELTPRNWHYSEEADLRAADAAAAEAYPRLGLKVAQVPIAKMAYYGGAIHCLTKQIPSGVKLPGT